MRFALAVSVLLLLAGSARADVNVALGKPVTLVGTFWEDAGWPAGTPAAPGLVVDGIFLPRGIPWNFDTVYWMPAISTTHYVPPQTIDIDLMGTYQIESLIIQADDNDSYLVQYHDPGDDSWKIAWEVPNYDIYDGINVAGMQTRPDPLDNTVRFVLPSAITADAFRLSCPLWTSLQEPGTDGWASISEFQAFADCRVPEPMTIGLLGLGLAGIIALRKKAAK